MNRTYLLHPPRIATSTKRLGSLDRAGARGYVPRVRRSDRQRSASTVDVCREHAIRRCEAHVVLAWESRITRSYR